MELGILLEELKLAILGLLDEGDISTVVPLSSWVQRLLQTGFNGSTALPTVWSVVSAMGKAHPLSLSKDVQAAEQEHPHDPASALITWALLALQSGSLAIFLRSLPSQLQIACAYNPQAPLRSKEFTGHAAIVLETNQNTISEFLCSQQQHVSPHPLNTTHPLAGAQPAGGASPASSRPAEQSNHPTSSLPLAEVDSSSACVRGQSNPGADTSMAPQPSADGVQGLGAQMHIETEEDALARRKDAASKGRSKGLSGASMTAMMGAAASSAKQFMGALPWGGAAQTTAKGIGSFVPVRWRAGAVEQPAQAAEMAAAAAVPAGSEEAAAVKVSIQVVDAGDSLGTESDAPARLVLMHIDVAGVGADQQPAQPAAATDPAVYTPGVQPAAAEAQHDGGAAGASTPGGADGGLQQAGAAAGSPTSMQPTCTTSLDATGSSSPSTAQSVQPSVASHRFKALMKGTAAAASATAAGAAGLLSQVPWKGVSASGLLSSVATAVGRGAAASGPEQSGAATQPVKANRSANGAVSGHETAGETDDFDYDVLEDMREVLEGHGSGSLPLEMKLPPSAARAPTTTATTVPAVLPSVASGEVSAAAGNTADASSPSCSHSASQCLSNLDVQLLDVCASVTADLTGADACSSEPEYCIRVMDSSGQSWTVSRRLSEFVELDKQLHAEEPTWDQPSDAQPGSSSSSPSACASYDPLQPVTGPHSSSSFQGKWGSLSLGVQAADEPLYRGAAHMIRRELLSQFMHELVSRGPELPQPSQQLLISFFNIPRLPTSGNAVPASVDVSGANPAATSPTAPATDPLSVPSAPGQVGAGGGPGGGGAEQLSMTVRLVVDLQPELPDVELDRRQSGLCAGCKAALQTDRDRASSGGAPGAGASKAGSWLKGSAANSAAGQPNRCWYTNKLYCSTCHHGTTQFIPAHVIHNWDSTARPVCCAAADFLAAVRDQPLLCIPALNPDLYNRVPPLKNAAQLRKQISADLEVAESAGGALAKRAGQIKGSAGIRTYLLASSLVDWWALSDLLDLSLGPFAKMPQWLDKTARAAAALAIAAPAPAPAS